GGNADFRPVEPGNTLTILDADGPAVLRNIWFTLYDPEPYHLKKLVLRMYWDSEATPSVEAPLGDFFGLGLGDYHVWESELLSVANERALNCFFPMPFQKHARITVTNEGKQKVFSFYFNLDYRALSKPLPADTLYFHAQFRQAQPNPGWTNRWEANGDTVVEDKRNLTGEGNYRWLAAIGRGHYVGVTMSVLQNQDGWWGEGDDMVSSTANPARPSTEQAQKIISSVRLILAAAHSPIGSMELRSRAKSAPAAALPFTASISIRRFRSPSPFAPPSSTATPTTARTIIIPWPTGIRRSHTRHSRRFHRWTRAFPNFSPSVA